MAERPSVSTSSSLVIGIDFGTTFSGVAYYHTLNDHNAGSGDDRDAKKIADNINVIKTWPNPNQQYLEKTPSIISYATNPPTWGGTVKPFAKFTVEHFKLGLEARTTDHYGLDEDSPPNSPPSRPGFHVDLPHKKPVDFAAEYLTNLYKYVQQDFLPRHYGKQFLTNQAMSCILTVPAIWTENAKFLTRQAAARAGVPSDKLLLITEPEAAALYCATNCTEADLDVGDRFLVCDAGGGTVVRKLIIAN